MQWKTSSRSRPGCSNPLSSSWLALRPTLKVVVSVPCHGHVQDFDRGMQCAGGKPQWPEEVWLGHPVPYLLGIRTVCGGHQAMRRSRNGASEEMSAHASPSSPLSRRVHSTDRSSCFATRNTASRVAVGHRASVCSTASSLPRAALILSMPVLVGCCASQVPEC